MATLLIRNLDDSVRDRLRVRAAERGRSMEEEARLILKQAVAQEASAGPGSGAALAGQLRAVAARAGYWDDVSTDRIPLDLDDPGAP